MKTIRALNIVLKDEIFESQKSYLRECISEIEELLRENTASKESLKQSMLNYDDCYDKLVKCQKYIVELETRLRVKEYPLKDIKDECMFDNWR